MLIYNLRVTQARCRRVGREVATAPIADYKVTTLQRWSDVRTTARKLESEIRNLDSKGRRGEDWISAERFLIWFEIFEKAWIGKGRFFHDLRHDLTTYNFLLISSDMARYVKSCSMVNYTLFGPKIRLKPRTLEGYQQCSSVREQDIGCCCWSV